MILEHVAIWTYQLEELKLFYETYFEGVAGDKYTNSGNGFSSYFLNFSGGSRLELMQMPGIPAHKNDIRAQFTGLIHMAFETGSKDEVNELTERLRGDGYTVVGEPRTTGDGYYESVILDPDENRLEIVYQPA
ncbi:MAG: glyoxalase [Roseivirga sp.]|nr:glyoxalase [Roseivirga sp.]